MMEKLKCNWFLSQTLKALKKEMQLVVVVIDGTAPEKIQDTRIFITNFRPI